MELRSEHFAADLQWRPEQYGSLDLANVRKNIAVAQYEKRSKQAFRDID